VWFVVRDGRGACAYGKPATEQVCPQAAEWYINRPQCHANVVAHCNLLKSHWEQCARTPNQSEICMRSGLIIGLPSVSIARPTPRRVSNNVEGSPAVSDWSGAAAEPSDRGRAAEECILRRRRRQHRSCRLCHYDGRISLQVAPETWLCLVGGGAVSRGDKAIISFVFCRMHKPCTRAISSGPLRHLYRTIMS
jgi:hypothetical protein